jgi:thiocyanate desulfurase
MPMRHLNRRNLLKLGAACLGGGVASAGINYLSGGVLHGGQPADKASGFDGVAENLGRYIYLTPQKLGGGTHAVDLQTNKTLAWISYWNYGDTCPISHHLAAYPPDSGDPYKGFEFVNSTQGGDNVLMYGIPTPIKKYGVLDRFGQGNHIYRVQYDGKSGQMELLEDISDTTGIGLGVHTVIYPDGKGFACADGQKDVAAFFTRARGNEKTKVEMAFRADWIPNAPNLGDTWLKGGTLRLTRLEQPKETGKYELQGTQGNKIDWEMAPMAELLVERGQIPGSSPRTLTGLDNAVHDTTGRWTAMVNRMCGASIIVDRNNWEPVCCLYACGSGESNLPIKKVFTNPDTWEVKFEEVANPVHEAGFNPSGSEYVIMNNLRANNAAVFDVSDADPRKWKRKLNVTDPEWKGLYPSPFHVAFSKDGSKCFFSVLHPKPGKSDVVVCDTKTWKIIKKFKSVGVDCQTMHITYDGKYVLQIFSGFQRMEAGAFVFRQDTLEKVGYMPNFGGHHDCVVVPSTVEELKWSRCCTV